MLKLIGLVLWLFLLVLLAYSILSWVTMSGHLDYDSPVFKIQRVLASICEPVLRPVRRLIPPVQVGGVGLDLSVIIVFLVISVLTSTVFR
ncbi:MAG TPA: YggT family protein [Acidimicrobiales bacterium]